jgi:hypothetical protein
VTKTNSNLTKEQTYTKVTIFTTVSDSTLTTFSQESLTCIHLETDQINPEIMSSFTVAQKLALKLYALKAKCQLTNRQYKMVTDLVEDVVNEYAPGKNG